jgi:hypothetical protein
MSSFSPPFVSHMQKQLPADDLSLDISTFPVSIHFGNSANSLPN